MFGRLNCISDRLTQIKCQGLSICIPGHLRCPEFHSKERETNTVQGVKMMVVRKQNYQLECANLRSTAPHALAFPSWAKVDKEHPASRYCLVLTCHNQHMCPYTVTLDGSEQSTFSTNLSSNRLKS